ncbi:hypothetical protein K491DRAFT_613717 [Lophiostoma macrostomum CBS 122681]|uniref:Uncharacterized protein n=1 Tax=Lophiostoma macrostomum CBS 122681 TaxID=1314788 RepID=A0A6A6SLU0_9PLEO|nr:hypothetical protein K491DRAFT_613717 [Lophiostoma macrostomum CBS 122681]
MKLSVALLSLFTAVALGQGQTCTAELVQSDDCASVIDANACYNQNRFAKGNGTLGCIDGTDNNDKARKACKCCSCVGAVMCTWASQNLKC